MGQALHLAADLLGGRGLASRFFQFAQLGAHQKPIPEALQRVIGQPPPPVQKAKQHDISIEKIAEGPQLKGNPVIDGFLDESLDPGLPGRRFTHQ